MKKKIEIFYHSFSQKFKMLEIHRYDVVVVLFYKSFYKFYKHEFPKLC